MAARSNSKTMVASICSSLNNDMVIDILARLPIKTLLRFKSVSKPLLSLITNPRFITSHLHKSTKNSSLIFHCSRDESPVLMLYYTEPTTLHAVHIPSSMKDDSPLKLGIHIQGSCGGLLYMKISFCCCLFDYGLWNPATRQFKNVKEPQQCIKVLSQGFGYSSKINDYKLVRIGYFLHPRSQGLDYYYDSDSDEEAVEYRRRVDSVVRALAFSWKTDSWRTVEDDALLGGRYTDPVSVKGYLYWKVSGEGNLANEEVVLAFDTANDVFRRIELPGLNQSNSDCSRTITGFKESLGLFVFHKDSSNSCFDLWVLNESRIGGNIKCWSKLLTVGPMSKIGQPISAWRGKIVMKSLEEDDSFFLYDPISQEVNDVPISSAGFYYFKVYDYVETLASVDGTYNIMMEDAPL